jgi:GR25 family glycosyltransferase involved in LPS biosynthesis
MVLPFDKIYFISLKKSVQRQKRLSAEFDKFGITDRNGNRPVMVEADNGQSPPHLVDNSKKVKRPRTSQSEIGCFASHRKVWKLFSESGLENCLILEDDIRFAPMVHEVFANWDKMPEWDYVNFGFTTNRISIVDTIKNCMIPELKTLCSGSGMWLTHAYSINQMACQIFEENTRVQFGGIDWQLTGIQDKVKSYGFLNKGPIHQEKVTFSFPSTIKHTQ